MASQSAVSVRSVRLRTMTRVAILAALTAVLAQIAVPIPGTPVPVTLQVLGVLLTGLLLPARQAAASMAVYVALGAAGLPVFAGGRAGAHILVGPTGGYLWGFVVGAAGVAALRARLYASLPPKGASASPPPSPPVWQDMVASAAGVVAIYLAGVVQLAAVTGASPGRAVAMGVVPFIPWDLAKAAVAAMVAPHVRRAISAASGSAAAPPAGPRAAAGS